MTNLDVEIHDCTFTPTMFDGLFTRQTGPKSQYKSINIDELGGMRTSVADLVRFCDHHGINPEETDVAGMYGEPTVMNWGWRKDPA